MPAAVKLGGLVGYNYIQIYTGFQKSGQNAPFLPSKILLFIGQKATVYAVFPRFWAVVPALKKWLCIPKRYGVPIPKRYGVYSQKIRGLFPKDTGSPPP